MLKNIIVTMFTRGSVAIAMLLNLIIISQFIGSEVLGQMSLIVLNMAIVHTFAEVYSGSALVYFIPRYSLSVIYYRGLTWIFVCSILVNLALLFYNANHAKLTLHVFLLSFISALHIFHNFLLLGREQLKMYNFLVFLQPALNVLVLLICIFPFRLRSIEAPLIALYVSYLCAFTISLLAVMAKVRACSLSKAINTKEIIKLGFINQLGNLAHMLSNRYNYYIIGALGMGLLGVYSGATSLIESVWVVSASMSPIVLTHVANQRDASNNASLTFLLARISLALSSACVLLLYFVPVNFFTAMLGQDFIAAKSIMLYLSPGVLAISFSSILSHYFSGLGLQKIQLSANLGGLAITLAFSYWMINLYGLKGACLVASGAYGVQALILTVVFMRRNKLAWTSFFTQVKP